MKIKLSKSQWEFMGRKAGWMKTAQIIIEKTVPMLCFQHGGSEACEESNKKFGFICPKCRIEKIK